MNKKDIFNNIITKLQSLCDDNGIQFKYHYNETHDVCIFRFEKSGKVFRYTIDTQDILYKKPELIDYEIHDKMMKMYDAARNEIG